MTPGPAERTRRTALTKALVALAAFAAVMALSGGPASAHDDAGHMEITAAEQVRALTIRVEVGLVYEGDGHLAADAEVTATLDGPSGPVDAVPLQRADGDSSLYSAEIDVPVTGSWTVDVTSSDPTAQASAVVAVVAASTTTAAPTTVAPTPTAPTTAEPSAVDAEPTAATTESDETSTSALLVAGGVAVLLAVAAGLLVLRRSRDPGEAASAE